MLKALLILIAIFYGNFSNAKQPIEVLPPDYVLNGKTKADLSATWWQWAFSTNDEINPVRDKSGINCGVGQNGNVWFLAGGFGSSKISRRCEIPSNKYVFFPVINMAYWPRQGSENYTCEQAKINASSNNNNAINLFVEIDGVQLENVRQFRARTEECFDIFAKVDRSLNPYNAYPSASDGYWVLLKPLSKGKHTVKFGGGYNAAGNPLGRMLQDIEYEITVK
ncbi:MAG: hypothetical protein K2Y28_06510 [Burkholderiaceae bacterium]|nr:hypothetical protein [Burkholderiaceae bacterium]